MYTAFSQNVAIKMQPVLCSDAVPDLIPALFFFFVPTLYYQTLSLMTLCDKGSQ
jgi:hypothetical protein